MNNNETPQPLKEENTLASIKAIKKLISPLIQQAKTAAIFSNSQDIRKDKAFHSSTPNFNRTCSIMDYDFVKKKETTDSNEPNAKAKGVKGKIDIKRSKSYTIIPKKQSLYQKQMEAKHKADEKLNELRIDQQEKELSLLKPKPDINPHSVKLLSQSPIKNYKPIHKRVASILKGHQTKLDTIKSTLEIEGKNNSLTPNKTSSLLISKKKSNFVKWIEVNEIWEQTRKAKLTYLKQNIANKEEKEEEMYFHPKIDPKSSKIADHLIKHQSPHLSVEDRLNLTQTAAKQRIMDIKRQLTPSFAPSINHSYKIGNDYYLYMEENQKQLYDSYWKNMHQGVC